MANTETRPLHKEEDMTRQAPATFALTLLAAAISAHAADFKLGDSVEVKLDTTATLGTMVRTDSPSPSDYGLVPSTRVPGAAPGQLTGPTGGSDLNFAKDHAVSTVLKGLFDLDIHGKNAGMFVRASVWHDFVLGTADAPYGNYPNGYQANAPLSDAGFAPSARFDGAMIRDAYIYGKADVGALGLVEARLGRQVLNWGTAQFLTGGINSAINPVDYAAQLRPGALAQEGKVPVGMLSLRMVDHALWGVDAFVPFESRKSVLPGCGTFFEAAPYLPQGCNLAAAVAAPIPGTPLSTISSLSEPSLLASNYYVHRGPDVSASKSGQFGLSGHYLLSGLNTDVRAYLLNTSASLPYLQVKVEDVAGSTLPPGLAGGLGRLTNPNGLQYATVYASNVHLFGLSFDSKINPGGRVFGELAYRPNQPLSMNGNDLLTAFLLRGPNSLLQSHSNILAIPAGGTFDAFDRYHVTTGSLGINQVVPSVLAADRLVLAGEVGFSHISGLPAQDVMRYGRPFAYGTAPYLLNGSLTACSEAAPGLSGVPGKTCTQDGFISANAWGLRMRAAATYSNVIAGVTLTPSLLAAYDVSGYSYDGTFSKGRTMLRPELRADVGKSYFLQLQYSMFSGGNYNLLSDRSNIVLAGGAYF